MGDPRRIRKKFHRPRHPWQRLRLENEKQLISEYGLKNKTELWKMMSILDSFADQSKILTPKLQQVQTKAQAEKESKEFLNKINSLGLLSSRATLADVLNLELRDLLNRRLQTLVHKKGLARSMDQARQFITHGHIRVGDKKVISPSYIVRIKEETEVGFSENSALTDPNHAERAETVSKSQTDKKDTPEADTSAGSISESKEKESGEKAGQTEETGKEASDSKGPEKAPADESSSKSNSSKSNSSSEEVKPDEKALAEDKPKEDNPEDGSTLKTEQETSPEKDESSSKTQDEEKNKPEGESK